MGNLVPNNIHRIIRYSDVTEDNIAEDVVKIWKSCQIIVVDAPFIEGNVQQRCQAAANILENTNLQFAIYRRLNGLADIFEWLQESLGKQQALLLKSNHSKYMQGHSPTFLKINSLLVGSAKIIGYSKKVKKLKIQL
jgi:hypothetical protein